MQPQTVITSLALLAGVASASLNLHPLEARQTPGAGVPAYLSDLPTIPISIAMQLATAVPASVITNTDAICSAYNGQKPAWLTALPADVQSVLTSYGSAVQSWASKYSSELASVTATAQITGLCAGPKAGASPTGSSGAAKTGTTSGASGASATGNGATKPTGAFAAGVIGAVGILGLAVGL